MKKLANNKVLVGGICCALFSMSSMAFAKCQSVGFEVMQTPNSSMKEKFGKNMFGKNPVSMGVNYQRSLYKMFGVEAGYIKQKRKKASVSLNRDEMEPGASSNGISANSTGYTKAFDSSFTTNHFYLGALVSKGCDHSFRANLLLGVSYSRFKATYTQTKENGAVITNTVERWFTRNKFVPMVKLSGDFSLHKNLSLRLMASWQQLDRIKAENKSHLFTDRLVKLQNQFNVGAGFKVKF